MKQPTPYQMLLVLIFLAFVALALVAVDHFAAEPSPVVEVGKPSEPVQIVFTGITLRPLLDAMRIVETGGEKDPANAIGDNGKSIGPYQIQLAYWFDSDSFGDYQQVRDKRYAERVMVNYWLRYCPDALMTGDLETLARIHNGGVGGVNSKATLAYWNRVLDQMITLAQPVSRIEVMR